jgi:DNA-binding HxlR family transcriptional regulator
MDQDFSRKVVEALCREWEETLAGSLLESKTIHDRLMEDGETIPDGTMNDVLTDLREAGLISASGFHDREEVAAHGNWNISDGDTELLCE